MRLDGSAKAPLNEAQRGTLGCFASWAGEDGAWGCATGWSKGMTGAKLTSKKLESPLNGEVERIHNV